MYKLVARMMYNRISSGLFRHQSIDQYAFTPHIRLEDAVIIVENVIEYVHEFDTPVWMMSMDMRKAFDTIDHEALLNGLRGHGVAEPYIHLLGKFYTGRQDTVNGSFPFPIQRGVKQRHVLSAILFNCVLDIAFE